MPKPMFMQPQAGAQADSVLSTTKAQDKQKAEKMDKHQLNRLLRKPRSKAYMDAMRQLDAGGHTHNQEKVKEIIDAIRNEFPEVEISGILLGIVSVCYLGDPYEVHSLDVAGDIIEHYECGQPMPGGLEKARGVALHGGYAYVEVYVDCCRCIGEDGSVAVVPC